MKHYLKVVLYVILASVAAAMPTYVASVFFDAPFLHGLVQFDCFVFALFSLLIPFQKSFTAAKSCKIKALKSVFYLLSLVPLWVYILFFSHFTFKVPYVGLFSVVYLLFVFLPELRFLRGIIFTVFTLFTVVLDWGVFLYVTFGLNLQDVFALASFYIWGIPLYFFVPLAQTALAVYFMRNLLFNKKESVKLPPIVVALTLIFALLLNALASLQSRQALFGFPIRMFMEQTLSKGSVSKLTTLSPATKEAFPVYKNELFKSLDTDKKTVFILMESLGLHRNLAFDSALLKNFYNANVSFLGLYLRKDAYTQGAEFEDFFLGGNSKDSLHSLAFTFKNKGFKTLYVHGYDGDFYNRAKTYKTYGFDSLYFKQELEQKNLTKCSYGFKGVCDNAVTDFLKSALNDNYFVYWTTLDAHPPYETVKLDTLSPYCKALNLKGIACTYFTLQENTIKAIASLANIHPEVKFIITGDHRPMVTVFDRSFVQSFYYRWVPLVILN